MQFRDTFLIDGTRKTTDGYLVADARVARTGIQTYRGYELGKPDVSEVRVYRPPAEVFATDAMRSFAHRPVTNDHPSVPVTPDNWRDHARGQTGDEVVRDGEFIRVPLMLTDAAIIAAVESGKRELSMGYAAELDFTPGITDAGEKYDAVQKNIRANHLAVVTTARGGPKLAIGDDKGTLKMTTKIVHVDGLPIETNDAGAAVIARLQSDIAKLTADNAAAVAKLTADVATRDAQIDDLKSKVVTDAQIDARAVARASLLDTARRIAPDVKTDNLSDADIRKAVVVAKCGDAVIADKSADYIAARFDILATDGAGSANDGARAAVQNLGDGAGIAGLTFNLADAEKAEKEAYRKSVDAMKSKRKPAESAA